MIRQSSCHAPIFRGVIGTVQSGILRQNGFVYFVFSMEGLLISLVVACVSGFWNYSDERTLAFAPKHIVEGI